MMADHIDPDDAVLDRKTISSVHGIERKQILVLDDEKGVRLAVQMMLKKEYEVFLAENGAEAMDILEKEKIDLIVTDIRLERENGLDVIEKALSLDNNMKFIVISAVPDEGTIKRANKLGARNILDKPFLVEDFQAAVRRALME